MLPRTVSLLIAIFLLTTSTFASSGAKVRSCLDRTLSAVALNDVAFRDAIDYLHDASGANFHVNWEALKAADVTPEKTVSIKLHKVSARKVLGLMLGQMGLAYYVDDEVVEITTKELADARMYVVIYPVQDLLAEPIPFDRPPDFGLGSKGSNGSNGKNSRQSGAFGTDSSSSTATQDKGARGDELVKLIMDTVKPEVWADNGGKATIKFFNGNLVVNAPRSVHEALGGSGD